MSEGGGRKLLLGGGALAVAAVVLVLVTPASQPPDRTEAIVMIDPTPEPTTLASALRCDSDVFLRPGWQGEYPGPAVDVLRPSERPGRATPCSSDTARCTLPIGLYHPWASRDGGYATLRAVDRYRARQAVEPMSVSGGPAPTIEAGTTVGVVFDLGEAMCLVHVGDREAVIDCPALTPDRFELVSNAGSDDIQVMQVDCAEGHRAWVDVPDSMVEDPDIAPGRIVGFGEVQPSTGPR